ncbi:hypothetical protein ACPFL9_05850 [Paenarthrobacter sp. NyZ202]
MSLALDEDWSGKNLNTLAQQLGGTYTEVNGFDPSLASREVVPPGIKR